MIHKKIIEISREIHQQFHTASLNLDFELKFKERGNITIDLKQVTSEIDFKRKLISVISRSCCEDVSAYWKKKMLESLNGFLGTDFDKREIALLYDKFGDGCHKGLCVSFIKSGYDMRILEEITVDEDQAG